MKTTIEVKKKVRYNLSGSPLSDAERIIVEEMINDMIESGKPHATYLGFRNINGHAVLIHIIRTGESFGIYSTSDSKFTSAKPE